jgi:hypothetical protein
MPYTLWSDGQLLGESELECARSPHHRSGGFWPTIVGSRLMPVATAVSRATSLLAAKSRDMKDGIISEDALDFFLGLDASCLGVVERSTEYADFAEAVDRVKELGLELRGPDGAVISTQSIDICESEFLTDLVRRELEIDYVESAPEDVYLNELDGEIDAAFELPGFVADDILLDDRFTPRLSMAGDDELRTTFALYQIRVRLTNPMMIL